jgi:DNA excision repair protein ERCC-3
MLPPDEQMVYTLAPKRQQFRIAAENPRKVSVLKDLLTQQADHRVLIIGEYLDQLSVIAAVIGLPLITRKNPSV